MLTGHPALKAASATPTASPLVGRGEEVRRLEAALARAASGRGGAVFLAGESGIGKTRLAQEVMALARGRGFLALEGQAYPLEGSLAYAPILAALGPYLRSLDATRQGRLVSGLPDLGRLFADLRLPAPEPLGDPALEKTRLFEAVSRLTERLSRERPVALLVDDLHWADPASIELLHYLARGLGEQRVLVLGAYRAEEVGAARGLRSLVKSLQRAGLGEELVVARLRPEAVVEMARAVLGAEPPTELLHLLEARAAGTPLFVAALVRALVEAGQLVRIASAWALTTSAAATLPPDVGDLIIERLERLAPDDRRVLDLVAVSGEATAHALLRAASGLDDETLCAALDRLRAAGLLAEEPAGAEIVYTPTHPLIQEVAYRGLSELARQRAHAAFAVALERLCPDGLTRLAHHYRGARAEVDVGRAFEVLIAAGERARGVYANDEAARHFGAALALLREGEVGARDRVSLPWLLERLGEGWEQVGESAAAIAVWTEALAIHERTGEIEAEARIRRLLAMAECFRSNFEAAEGHLAAGLSLLGDTESSPEWVNLNLSRLIILRRRGDIAGMTAAAAALPALAVQCASPWMVAEAGFTEMTVRLVRGEYASARERAMSILATAEAAGEPMVAMPAYHGLTLGGLCLGDHNSARQHAERWLELARHLGAPPLEFLPRAALSASHFFAGRWDEAIGSAAEALALARRAGRPRDRAGILGLLSMILSLRGELAEAGACLDEARAALGSAASADRMSTDMATFQIVFYLEHEGAQGGEAMPPVVARSPELSHIPPLSMALWAEAQIMAGEIEAALSTARRLSALDPSGRSYPAALASRVEGSARRARGEVEAAATCLARAAGLFCGLDMPFEAARARLEWAMLSTGDPAGAVAALQESLTVFERLGARRYASRARQALLGLGIHPPAMRRPRPSDGRLSARELEVARLVADGLTNAEIAGRLVLSTRTVTTHLERIYARLGINSRAALARYVTAGGAGPSADHNT